MRHYVIGMPLDFFHASGAGIRTAQTFVAAHGWPGHAIRHLNSGIQIGADRFLP